MSISLFYTPRRPTDTSPAGYGVPIPFSTNTFYPGLTPRAVIFRPFRAHRAFRRIAQPPANGNNLIPTTHNLKPTRKPPTPQKQHFCGGKTAYLC